MSLSLRLQLLLAALALLAAAASSSTPPIDAATHQEAVAGFGESIIAGLGLPSLFH